MINRTKIAFQLKNRLKRAITYTFTPQFKTVNKFKATATVQEFQNEQSMYSATIEFVKKNGGPISNMILDKIPESYYLQAKSMGLYPNIDIRVHQFEKIFFGTPGLELYPAIPGLHCDGEWRETYFSQPDPQKIPVSNHLIATIASNKGISNTQFLKDKVCVTVNNVQQEYTLWEQVDKLVRENQHIRFQPMHDGELTLFDARTLHEANPVCFPGWRMFFRCSMWHKPNLGEGKLSLNEQLYTIFSPIVFSKAAKTGVLSMVASNTHHTIKCEPKI